MTGYTRKQLEEIWKNYPCLSPLKKLRINLAIGIADYLFNIRKSKDEFVKRYWYG